MRSPNVQRGRIPSAAERDYLREGGPTTFCATGNRQRPSPITTQQAPAQRHQWAIATGIPIAGAHLSDRSSSPTPSITTIHRDSCSGHTPPQRTVTGQKPRSPPTPTMEKKRHRLVTLASPTTVLAHHRHLSSLVPAPMQRPPSYPIFPVTLVPATPYLHPPNLLTHHRCQQS